jgi:hypothetical protein
MILTSGPGPGHADFDTYIIKPRMIMVTLRMSIIHIPYKE